MKKRVSNYTKARYKKIVGSLINDLSKAVEVFKKPLKNECPNCYFDKTTNTSTNTCRWTLPETLQKQQEYVNSGGIGIRYKFFSKSRCPICKGKGFLEVFRKQWVNCKVTWNPLDTSDFLVGPSGIDTKLLVELKTDPKYLQLFSTCDTIKIGDISCKLYKPPIVRGLGNDSILVVIAFTDQVIDESTIVDKDYK